MRERVRLPIDCDMSQSSLQWAWTILREPPIAVVVHPCAKHLAGSLIYQLGWRHTEVFVDTDMTDEDSWVLRGETREVFSDGA